MRTVLVTGASSGIGLATARLLAGHGYRVLGTSRDPGRIADPLPGVDYLPLDLADRESIAACAAAAGPVDVLVNNAGESQSGPLEELPMDAIDRLFQLNVLGPVQLTQLVLPGMRERKFGRVVMVGSMIASFPVAFRSSYTASKAAIKGFADATRVEVAPYGIGISTVEPGSIRTGISERRTNYLAEGSPYTERFQSMLKTLDADERAGIPGDKVAATILKAIEDRKPHRLYAVGSNAPLAFSMKRVLPGDLAEKIVATKYGLS